MPMVGGPSACGSGPSPRRTPSVAEPSADAGVRYEPDERPPIALTLGSGLQSALVVVAPVVITVAIVARIAGQPDAYIAFAALRHSSWLKSVHWERSISPQQGGSRA